LTALIHVILLAIIWISAEDNQAKYLDNFHCLFYHGSVFVKIRRQISTWILYISLHALHLTSLFFNKARVRLRERLGRWKESIQSRQICWGCWSYSPVWIGFYVQSIDITPCSIMKLPLDEVTPLHHCCKTQFYKWQYQLYTQLLIIFFIDCVVKFVSFFYFWNIIIAFQRCFRCRAQAAIGN
jgi:hypothetical protein